MSDTRLPFQSSKLPKGATVWVRYHQAHNTCGERAYSAKKDEAILGELAADATEALEMQCGVDYTIEINHPSAVDIPIAVVSVDKSDNTVVTPTHEKTKKPVSTHFSCGGKPYAAWLVENTKYKETFVVLKAAR